MKDYETAYYEIYYKYRKLLQKNKELEQEIELFKKYSKGDLKEIIIKEIVRRNIK
jgi:hypothetical protein